MSRSESHIGLERQKDNIEESSTFDVFIKWTLKNSNQLEKMISLHYTIQKIKNKPFENEIGTCNFIKEIVLLLGIHCEITFQERMGWKNGKKLYFQNQNGNLKMA